MFACLYLPPPVNAGTVAPVAQDFSPGASPANRRQTAALVQIARDFSPRVETHGDRIYKITEIVDGREVVRYTDKKPVTGPFVVLGK